MTEGEVLNDWTLGRYRLIWQAKDESLTCGGEFSILQTGDRPDGLLIRAKGIDGRELSRRDAEGMVRNLSRWLEVGDETLPDAGRGIPHTGSKDPVDEDLQKRIKDAVRQAAGSWDVERAVLRIDRPSTGRTRWRFLVLWGRDIVYTDMIGFMDGCRWVEEYAEFYFSEDAREIRKPDGSRIETIYERRGPGEDRGDIGSAVSGTEDPGQARDGLPRSPPRHDRVGDLR